MTKKPYFKNSADDTNADDPIWQIVNTIDLSLKELATLTRPDSLEAVRANGICVTWTHLPEFVAWTVNVFAPVSTVFRDFAIYNALRTSEACFCWPMVSGERADDTIARMTAIARKAGNKRRSSFVHAMFGNLTLRPEFQPSGPTTALEVLGHRHWSILVPESDRPALQHHLEEQAKTMSDRCLLTYPETKRRGYFDEMNRTGEAWTLLNTGIAQMAAPEREWLYASAEAYSTENSLAALAATLDRRFFVKGFIGLAGVPPRFREFVDMDKFATVLRFRLRMALLIAPLPAIESQLQGIQTSDQIFRLPRRGARGDHGSTAHAFGRVQTYRRVRASVLCANCMTYDALLGRLDTVRMQSEDGSC